MMASLKSLSGNSEFFSQNSHPLVVTGDWFQDPNMWDIRLLNPGYQVHGCSSPLYKMTQSLHIT